MKKLVVQKAEEEGGEDENYDVERSEEAGMAEAVVDSVRPVEFVVGRKAPVRVDVVGRGWASLSQ
jgi:hypothetical protein